MNRVVAEVGIIGASLGGVMAAYQACRAGRNVVLTSEFSWLGGQMTSQGVPPDEHPLIESGGATETYLAFRQAIRQHYLDDPDFQDCTEMTEGCNPGDGWVSRLCFEPSVAAAYFENLLLPFVQAGHLRILRNVRLFSAARMERMRRKIDKVIVQDHQNQKFEIAATWYLDATDTGALIKAAGLAYRIGKEAQSEFGEPDAPSTGSRLDQQPVTYVMALQRLPRPSTVGTAPADYAFWKAYVLPQYGYRLFSHHIPGSGRGAAIELPFFGEGPSLDLWRYRRVVSAANWHSPRVEVSLINWAQNDFALQALLDGPWPEDSVISAARRLSLCWLYWLQTEAPRPEGGLGYPELQLAPGVLGTDDGLAQQVYVRESRRIVGLACLSQNDIAAPAPEASPDLAKLATLAHHCEDSVGLAWYNMDIHPTCISGHGVNAKVRPFCLPLGCFVPVDCDNLIPACKNISVTHLVNAATRVHPVEWLIGEVAGMLAHFALSHRVSLAEVAADATLTTQFQQALSRIGVPLVWTPELLGKIPAQAH